MDESGAIAPAGEQGVSQPAGTSEPLRFESNSMEPAYALRPSTSGAPAGTPQLRYWSARPPLHHPYRTLPPRVAAAGHGYPPYGAVLHPYPSAPPLLARRPAPGYPAAVAGAAPYGRLPPGVVGYGPLPTQDDAAAFPQQPSPFMAAEAQAAMAVVTGGGDGGSTEAGEPASGARLAATAASGPAAATAYGGTVAAATATAVAAGGGSAGGARASEGGATSAVSGGGAPPPSAVAPLPAHYSMPAPLPYPMWYGMPYRARRVMYGYPAPPYYHAEAPGMPPAYVRPRLGSHHSTPLAVQLPPYAPPGAVASLVPPLPSAGGSSGGLAWSPTPSSAAAAAAGGAAAAAAAGGAAAAALDPQAHPSATAAPVVAATHGQPEPAPQQRVPSAGGAAFTQPQMPYARSHSAVLQRGPALYGMAELPGAPLAESHSVPGCSSSAAAAASEAAAAAAAQAALPGHVYPHLYPHPYPHTHTHSHPHTHLDPLRRAFSADALHLELLDPQPAPQAHQLAYPAMPYTQLPPPLPPHGSQHGGGGATGRAGGVFSHLAGVDDAGLLLGDLFGDLAADQIPVQTGRIGGGGGGGVDDDDDDERLQAELRGLIGVLVDDGYGGEEPVPAALQQPQQQQQQQHGNPHAPQPHPQTLLHHNHHQHQHHHQQHQQETMQMAAQPAPGHALVPGQGHGHGHSQGQGQGRRYSFGDGPGDGAGQCSAGQESGLAGGGSAGQTSGSGPSPADGVSGSGGLTPRAEPGQGQGQAPQAVSPGVLTPPARRPKPARAAPRHGRGSRQAAAANGDVDPDDSDDATGAVLDSRLAWWPAGPAVLQADVGGGEAAGAGSGLGQAADGLVGAAAVAFACDGAAAAAAGTARNAASKPPGSRPVGHPGLQGGGGAAALNNQYHYHHHHQQQQQQDLHHVQRVDPLSLHDGLMVVLPQMAAAGGHDAAANHAPSDEASERVAYDGGDGGGMPSSGNSAPRLSSGVGDGGDVSAFRAGGGGGGGRTAGGGRRARRQRQRTSGGGEDAETEWEADELEQDDEEEDDEEDALRQKRPRKKGAAAAAAARRMRGQRQAGASRRGSGGGDAGGAALGGDAGDGGVGEGEGEGEGGGGSGDEAQLAARPTLEQLLAQSGEGGGAELELLGELDPAARDELLARVARKGKGGRAPAEDPRLDPSIDPRKARRILANRLSAARSKLKQKLILEGLKARYQQLMSCKAACNRELSELRRACKELELRNNGLAGRLRAMSEEPPSTEQPPSK